MRIRIQEPTECVSRFETLVDVIEERVDAGKFFKSEIMLSTTNKFGHSRATLNLKEKIPILSPH
jgi:hypothetical protein